MADTARWTRRRLLEATAAVSTAMAIGPALTFAAAPTSSRQQWRNWGGNLSSTPLAIKKPRSEDEVVDIMRTGTGGIRAVGSGHSWSALVPTNDTIVSLDGLSGLLNHDNQTMQAEVLGGTKLFMYGPLVEEVGQAIVNMSDINYQTMAGAVSTSTHGTGHNLGSMSSYLAGIQLVTPAGEVIDCSTDKEPDLIRPEFPRHFPTA